jgi:hypothetical protein
LRLPVAPLLAGDAAKVLEGFDGARTVEQEPPGTSVKSKDCGLTQLQQKK